MNPSTSQPKPRVGAQGVVSYPPGTDVEAVEKAALEAQRLRDEARARGETP